MNIVLYILSLTPWVLTGFSLLFIKEFKSHFLKRPSLYIWLGGAVAIYPFLLMMLGSWLVEIIQCSPTDAGGCWIYGRNISDSLYVLSFMTGMTFFISIPVSIILVIVGIANMMSINTTPLKVAGFLFLSYIMFHVLMAIISLT